MRYSFIYVLFVLLLSSCANITTIEGQRESKETQPKYSYTEKFLKRIAGAKELFRKNQADKALATLKGIRDSELNPLEKASRDNLSGVILFSKGKMDEALKYFEKAAAGSQSDELLFSQTHLNLAGAFFKKGLSEKAFEVLQKTKGQGLGNEELKKFHLLSSRLAKDLGKDEVELEHLYQLAKGKKNLAEAKGDASFERMRALLAPKGIEVKNHFFYSHEADHSFIAGYLAYEAAEKLLYSSQRDEARRLLDWIKEQYPTNTELQDLSKVLLGRLENFSKIDINAAGVVFPLSGDKKEFSERVLKGLDLALKKAGAPSLALFVKDSEGTGPVGAFAVKELIEKNNVAVIIGGLFPDEATNEYLEARRNGVFFISLSSIYLPKEQKDHLLLEIPGSIESQMNDLFSSEMLSVIGKRAAIVYPKGPRGDAYVEEFWRRSQLAGVEVTGVMGFEKNQTDYRDTVKGLLELKYKRERQEELDLLSGVQTLEKNNTRRVQVLGPQVDFDWVFMPALPKEALQIIPAFGYFDAFKLSYVGDASWRSQLMTREGGRMDRIYFVADDLDPNEKVFSKAFEEKYGQAPKLLEYMGYDSLELARNFLIESKAGSRDELDLFIKNKQKISGLTGAWAIQEGVWMKSLGRYQIKRGKIEDLGAK